MGNISKATNGVHTECSLPLSERDTVPFPNRQEIKLNSNHWLLQLIDTIRCDEILIFDCNDPQQILSIESDEIAIWWKYWMNIERI